MSKETFRVQLEKDTLVFSAAHFITFNGNVCESLHGHNYRVKCEVVGPLDENGYVVDFIALRDALTEIISTLDHHVVLPAEHPLIKVVDEANEVLVTFESKRWIFPSEDCVILPIANTTAELMARYRSLRWMRIADNGASARSNGRSSSMIHLEIVAEVFRPGPLPKQISANRVSAAFLILHLSVRFTRTLRSDWQPTWCRFYRL